MAYLKEILGELKTAMAVLRLETSAFAHVYEKRSAMKWGVLILIFPQIVKLILSVFIFPSGFSAIFSRFLFWPVVIPVAVLSLVFLVMSLVAERGLNGHANHKGFFKVLAYASIVFWITLVPTILDVLGFGLGNGFYNLLWFAAFVYVMVIAYNLLVKEYKLGPQGAVICIASGVVTYFLVHLFLGQILVGSYYRIF